MAIATASPLFVAISIVEFQPVNDPLVTPVLLACALAATLGLVPGIAFLDMVAGGHETRRSIVAAFWASLGTAYLLIVATLNLAPASSIVLYTAGVYELRPHIYEVSKPDVVMSMYAAHVPAYPVMQKKEKPASFFVQAYLRYNFGGVKLLCGQQYDPRAVEIYAAKLKEQGQSGSRTRIGNDAVIEVRWKGGAWCVPVESDEARRIRRDEGFR